MLQRRVFLKTTLCARSKAKRKGHFDVVVMLEVLEHLKDDVGALNTIHRLLEKRRAILSYLRAKQGLGPCDKPS